MILAAKTFIHQLYNTYNNTRQPFLYSIIPALFMLLIIALIRLVYGIEISVMTSDIFSIAHVSSFTGVLSDCDSFGWCTAAAITFFAGGAMRHRLSSTEFKFMMFSGGLSSYLLFDDFFMFHEQLAPQYLGLSEHDIYIVLGVMVLSYLFAFRQVILQTNFFLLFFAVSCLGMSVVTDTLSPWLWRLLDWEYLIEDGFKWLGIVSWAVYFGNTSYYFVVRHLQPREARI